jgi:anti-anti-sigma regulatory factor
MASATTARQQPIAVAPSVGPDVTQARFTRRRCSGWTILSATGVLDSAATPELKTQFEAALADGLFIIVDLSQARLADASVTELLVGMDNLLHAFGGRLSTISAR